jgi:putative aldouronate transport system substrate-binding protein
MMKKNGLRFIKPAFFLFAALIVQPALFAGGGSDSGASRGAGGKTVVRWLVPGAPIPDQARVMAAVNKKLEADGLNIELRVERIDWEVWEQKTNLMISTKEEFDLIHVMQGTINFDVYASRRATAPIDESMLAQYGPQLLANIPKEEWDAARYQGKIYTVPDIWVNMATEASYHTGYRKDLFDKYKVAVPNTLDEFITNSAALQKAIYDDIGERYYWLIGIDRPFAPLYNTETDPGWPYTTDAGLGVIKINADGSMESLLESNILREGCYFMRRAFVAGLLMPDLLSIPRDTYMTNLVSQGRGMYTAAGYWEALNTLIPESEVEILPLMFPKEMTLSSFLNSNAISATSKHPEAAIQILNWIQTRENGQLLAYGELGVDWRKSPQGDQYYIPAKTDGSGYNFDMWEFLPYQFRLYTERTPSFMLNPPPVEKIYYSITNGFLFDSAPVLPEITNLNAKFAELCHPLFLGLIDYDQNIGRIMGELRSLGLDKYIAEYTRQFRAWQAANR